MFSHNWLYGASCVLLSTNSTTAKNYCINSYQILFNDKEQVLVVSRTQGSKSAIYDCIVCQTAKTRGRDEMKTTE